MTKEQAIYNLAQQIFIRKMPINHLNEKNQKDYENKIDDSIAVAKLFFERVEKDENNSS